MNEKNTMKRRRLFVLGGAGLAALGLSACGQSKKKGGDDKTKTGESTDAATGCAAPVDAKSKQMRKTLQYVAKSPKPDKNCVNCAQYVADKHGECGGCNLFSGPVQPKGYCASWAAKADAAPSASTSATAT